jgi:hypothetical protein
VRNGDVSVQCGQGGGMESSRSQEECHQVSVARSEPIWWKFYNEQVDDVV